MIELVRSGGQTGADIGGLRGARSAGVPTCGWAPRGWRTEAGPAPWLADFGVMEASSADYAVRTEMNVRESHGTLLVGDRGSAGSRLTLDLCRRLGRPYLCVVWRPGMSATPRPDTVAAIRQWAGVLGIRWLNVAGNRESVAPGIEVATAALVSAVLAGASGAAITIGASEAP